jgi:hypothetical protein
MCGTVANVVSSSEWLGPRHFRMLRGDLLIVEELFRADGEDGAARVDEAAEARERCVVPCVCQHLLRQLDAGIIERAHRLLRWGGQQEAKGDQRITGHA